MWLRTFVSSALNCIMFADLCHQIHRDRCDPLFWRKIQGDNSKVCVPPRHWNAHTVTGDPLMFSCLLNVWFVVLSSSSSGSSTLPDSRVNLEFSKWSNAGEFSKEKEKRARRVWDQDVYSIINLFYLLVRSLRESVYQQRRESGRQHSGSPQNLQKHWDRNVSL